MRGSGDLGAVTREPCLKTEGASGPALARKAVTHRDAQRLTFDNEPQLAATAGGHAWPCEQPRAFMAERTETQPIHRCPTGRLAIVARIPESARAVLEGPALAHLVTLEPDGRPQVSIVWIGVDGDELVAGHLPEQRKIRNIRRDPRVALSVEAGTRNEIGLDEYIVIHGSARVTEGGAAELLQQLALVYLGPDVKFPPMDDPPPGFITHITVERVGGVGPWAR